MDMFPNNDTMHTVTGTTTCNNINGQTIDWSVKSSKSASAPQQRWSWLCLVGTLVAGLSLQRTL